MRLYRELATWWPLLSPASDYEDEIPELVGMLGTHGAPHTVLELGAGGGSVAWWLKRGFELTLTDLSAEMLAVSAGLNPECVHVVGDMRVLDLGRRFDAVLIHDAVMYAATRADLAATLATARRHLEVGGTLVVLPDFVAETFRAGTSTGGHDAADGRGLRYVEWAWDPDPADESFEIAYAFLLREPGAAVAVEGDRHRLGLFARETWLELLGAAGFDAGAREDSFGRTVFIGLAR